MTASGVGHPSAQQLQDALERALRLAGAEDEPRLRQISQRLTERRLRVLVAGEAKRGKSTVVNALLERPLLPTGLTPLTSVATTVTAAGPDGDEHVVVRFADGRPEVRSLAELPDYVTESSNPGNRAGVSDVRVLVHHRLLETHAADVVDSPGTGSVFEHNTREAELAREGLDAAVVVLTADPPISGPEKELLRQVSTTATRTFVLVNKSDRLTSSELRETVAFTERICSQAMGRPVSVFSCSARCGREDPGFAAFAKALEDYLSERADADVLRAIAGHLHRAVAAMRDDALVRLHGMELTVAGQGRAAIELRERLSPIAGTRDAIGDRCLGAVAGLRRELDERAARAVPAFSRRCLVELDEALSGRLASTSAPELEGEAQAVVRQSITEAVEKWRRQTATWLQDGLAHIAMQVTSDVSAQVELARQAVQDVLSLAVRTTPPEPGLEETTRFWYDFSPPAAWEAPLRSTVSRLRPAAVRRRRTVEHVRAQVRPLTDRQLGRARSDLQTRLEAGGRRLVLQLDEQFDQTIRRLLTALSGLGADDQGDAEGHIEALGQRVADLEGVLAALDTLSARPPDGRRSGPEDHASAHDSRPPTEEST